MRVLHGERHRRPEQWVRVKGFGHNTSAKIIVTAKKTGVAVDGSATIDNSSLEPPLSFTLTDAARTADGFKAKVTGYTTGYVWTAAVTGAEEHCPG